MLYLINQLKAATVGKIPDGTQVNVSKEAKAAIGKAASVFILYATSWYGISALLFCFSESDKANCTVRIFTLSNAKERR